MTSVPISGRIAPTPGSLERGVTVQRRKLLRLLALLVLVSGLALVASACGGDDEEASGTTTAEEDRRRRRRHARLRRRVRSGGTRRRAGVGWRVDPRHHSDLRDARLSEARDDRARTRPGDRVVGERRRYCVDVQDPRRGQVPRRHAAQRRGRLRQLRPLVQLQGPAAEPERLVLLAGRVRRLQDLRQGQRRSARTASTRAARRPTRTPSSST